MELPAFDQVQDALLAAGSVVDGSECHGVLCGILCASGSSDMQGWVRHLFENRTESGDIPAAALQVLHDLHQATLTGINHETLEFNLLLPDDGQGAEKKLQALADWCSGFSFGLTLGGLRDQMLNSDDSREFVQDLQHIANASLGVDGRDDEHTEQSLTEIEEYIRMGVLMLNEDLQPVTQSPSIH